MAKGILADEFHLAVRAPPGLLDAEYVSIRGTRPAAAATLKRGVFGGDHAALPQPLQNLQPSAVKPGLDRADRAADDVGDFLVRQPRRNIFGWNAPPILTGMSV
jgi:hypothetical protein